MLLFSKEHQRLLWVTFAIEVGSCGRFEYVQCHQRPVPYNAQQICLPDPVLIYTVGAEDAGFLGILSSSVAIV